MLCGRRAESEAVSNVRGQNESEAEGHQECRYDAHKYEDREQFLVNEAELESNCRDDKLHRPASVHRDSCGHGVPAFRNSNFRWLPSGIRRRRCRSIRRALIGSCGDRSSLLNLIETGWGGGSPRTGRRGGPKADGVLAMTNGYS